MKFRNCALIILCLLCAPLRAQGYVECEDTCHHIHGIDLSHYQGNVFWETVGDNTKMAYVYLKATEGGSKIDAMYQRNIDLAHRYGLKVGSYHFFIVLLFARPHRQPILWLNADQVIRI